MREVVGHDVALILAQLGDEVALGPFRRVFLPEGLAPAFPLAALLIRLGLLLGTKFIGLQNGPRSWTDPRGTPYWGASG
uniref:Uncharacterized protein n=1 Tax=Myoviridae sp. ctWPU11 TaxID=2825118 RepID=A0A8S5UAB0_9CAUD|nr:MAG TPA: hypothetical protein [Myoviridae sp. ctWPU11]